MTSNAPVGSPGLAAADHAADGKTGSAASFVFGATDWFEMTDVDCVSAWAVKPTKRMVTEYAASLLPHLALRELTGINGREPVEAARRRVATRYPWASGLEPPSGATFVTALTGPGAAFTAAAVSRTDIATHGGTDRLASRAS